MRRWEAPATADERDVPPPSLVRRLAEALDGRREGDADASDVPDAYLDAAEALFARVLDAGCTSRDHALDLLTVDALVTYALEAAADRPDEVAERARTAMRRFARMAVSD